MVARITGGSLVPGYVIGLETDLFYDLLTLNCLAKYVAFGLDPGSYCVALLQNDVNRIPGLASFRNKNLDIRDLQNSKDADVFRRNPKQEVWQTMLEWVNENVHPLCRGDEKAIYKWINHSGLTGCSKDILALFKLSSTEYWFIEHLLDHEKEWFDWNRDVEED